MPNKCDVVGCDQNELTQGMCYDHAAICPKCKENPCNGTVSDPECNICIMAYRPEKDDGEDEFDW